LVFTLGCDRGSQTSTGGSQDTQISSSGSSASSAPTRQDTSSEQADNTGKNVRDRSDQTLTPTDQSENRADLDLTRRIRRAVTANDRLSSEAKNIKIITSGGKVTLRGPVKSDDERKTITSIAQQIAGDKVEDQLEIQTKNQ
jgi:osmotically-inducible protein OsmY